MQTLDNSQFFTIWSDEINGRIDPSFYKLSSNSFSGVRLEDFINKISSGDYISRDKFVENGVPYLRVQNLKSDGIEIGDLFLKDNEKISKTNRKMFLTGRVGSLGIFRMAKGEYFYSDNILSIEFKEDKKIDLDYLEIILNFPLVTEQIIRNCKGNNQKLISQETIRNLQIPLPSFSIQNKIISIMQEAYKEKKEKEADAQRLLDSVDDFVLGELGIKIPEIKKEMVFEVWSDEIENSRIDAEYYQNFYKIFIEEIKKCKFKQKNLEDITEFIKNGLTPAKEDYTEDSDAGIPIIKAGTASRKFVDLKKVDYVKNNFKGKQSVKRGDIFILSAAHQSEYVGKNVSLLDENPKKETFFVGELIGVRANPEECLSEYLFSFISSKFAFTLINHEKRGQTSHIYPEDLKNLPIPLPPLDIQEKIANNIKSFYNKAGFLKKEAREVLEKAKKEVEEMILGK